MFIGPPSCPNDIGSCFFSPWECRCVPEISSWQRPVGRVVIGKAPVWSDVFPFFCHPCVFVCILCWIFPVLNVRRREMVRVPPNSSHDPAFNKIFPLFTHSPVSLTYRCIDLYRHMFYYIHYNTTIHFWTLYYNISQLWCRTCTSARGLKPPALLLPSPVSRTFILFWAAPYWSSASRDYHRSGDNCHPETGTHCLPVCLNLTPSSCYNTKKRSICKQPSLLV